MSFTDLAVVERACERWGMSGPSAEDVVSGAFGFRTRRYWLAISEVVRRCSPVREKVCVTCGTSIGHMKRNSLYCSRACNARARYHA